MQDLYIFIVEDFMAEQPSLITSREMAVGEFSEYADSLETAVKVYKANPSDNTCYDVTGDIAEAAFDAWDETFADEPDAQIPPLYDTFKFERKERYDDNREHAADYRARAV